MHDAVLAPVVVNILLHHLYLDPSGAVLGWVLVGLGLFLAFAHGPASRGVRKPVTPSRFGKREG